jgi:hypothetical protein
MLVAEGVTVITGGMLVAQIAIDKNIPLEYYVATLVILGAVYGIVRGTMLALSWLDRRDKDHRHEILKEIRLLIGSLPCQRDEKVMCKEEE